MALTGYQEQRVFLRRLFSAALAAVDPGLCLPPHLQDIEPPRGRTIVLGAGKAAAAMAHALEQHWAGPLEGFVVTRYGHDVSCKKIEVIEASHPIPDAAGAAAAFRALELAQGATEDDLVLALFSGGGSSLLAAPAPGLALAEKQAINRALLSSGASIHEINCVRKHLSAIKGGRLAQAAWPARVLTLALSDVPNDDPAVIASGPTLLDPTTCAYALEILDRYGIELPVAARQGLQSGAFESAKSSGFPAGEFRLIGSAQQALAAAAEKARAAGVTPLILGDAIEGEAREAARVLAGIALSCAAHGIPLAAPCVLLSGGETTVTVKGHGRGGRNAEFQLALALALDGHPRIHALACDTDGIDGSEDNAGAIVTPDTLARARSKGINARLLLADNDAYGFFAELNDLVVTGPTRTNVNDFRAILIERRG